MTTLFLASSGLGALESVLPAEPTELRLGLITTAAEVFETRDWVQRERVLFESQGFDVVDMPLDGDLSIIDVIFVTGGNTYYLLQEIREAGFDKALPEFLSAGGVYAGTSAGAIICGPDIDVTAEPDQRAAAPLLESTTGLGLVPFSILPHAGVENERFITHHTRVLNSGNPVWRISDNEAIVVKNQSAQVVWSPRV